MYVLLEVCLLTEKPFQCRQKWHIEFSCTDTACCWCSFHVKRAFYQLQHVVVCSLTISWQKIDLDFFVYVMSNWTDILKMASDSFLCAESHTAMKKQQQKSLSPPAMMSNIFSSSFSPQPKYIINPAESTHPSRPFLFFVQF